MMRRWDHDVANCDVCLASDFCVCLGHVTVSAKIVCSQACRDTNTQRSPQSDWDTCVLFKHNSSIVICLPFLCRLPWDTLSCFFVAIATFCNTTQTRPDLNNTQRCALEDGYKSLFLKKVLPNQLLSWLLSPSDQEQKLMRVTSYRAHSVCLGDLEHSKQVL